VKAKILETIGRALVGCLEGRFAIEVDRQFKIEEAICWLRAGSRTRALEVLEQLLKSYKGEGGDHEGE
jgi:hypothetical protein